MAVYDVLSHGAVGDGQTNDAAGIQAAIDAAAEAGGGTVVLPAGRVYLCGSIALKSNIEFRVERGARLLSAADGAAFPHRVFDSGPEADKRLWIGAHDAENFAITGGGVIDGNCMAFVTEKRGDSVATVKWRPAMTCFVNCRGIRIYDITMVNAANWTLHFAACEDIVVHGITIRNGLRFPNCDGIDPDHCRNVRISDCHIEAGDDCIVLKNTATFDYFGPTENVTVTGCTLVSTSCAIKIGSESVDDFRNLIFDSCVITNSNRGFGIQLRDQGNVENVLLSNCIIRTRQFSGKWWGCGEPLYVTTLPRNPETTPGRVRNVRLTNIICQSENGVMIHGCRDAAVENLLLENVRLEIARSSREDGARRDLRPCAIENVHGYTADAALGDPTPWGQVIRARMPGVFAYRAKDLSLRHVEVAWADDMQDFYSHAVECHDVENLRLEGFRGEAAHPERDAARVGVL